MTRSLPKVLLRWGQSFPCVGIKVSHTDTMLERMFGKKPEASEPKRLEPASITKINRIVEQKKVPDLTPERAQDVQRYRQPIENTDERGDKYYRLEQQLFWDKPKKSDVGLGLWDESRAQKVGLTPAEQAFLSRFINSVPMSDGRPAIPIVKAAYREENGVIEYYSRKADPDAMPRGYSVAEIKAQQALLFHLFGSDDEGVAEHTFDRDIVVGKPKLLAPAFRPVMYFDLGNCKLNQRILTNFVRNGYEATANGVEYETEQLLLAFRRAYEGEAGVQLIKSLVESSPEHIAFHSYSMPLLSKDNLNAQAIKFQNVFLRHVDGLLKMLREGPDKGQLGFDKHK